MKGYSILILLLSCAGCMGQPITLSAPAVVEGTDLMIVVTCTASAPVTGDASFTLEYDASSNSEDGFDHSLIGTFECHILDTQTVGIVSIPLIDDKQVDSPNPETLTIGIVASDLAPNTVYTLTGPLSVMITDDADVASNVVPRKTAFKGKEGGMVDITLDFVDVDGNPAPMEDDRTLVPTFSAPPTDTAEAGDFTDPGSVTIPFTGTPVTSATIQIMLINDALVENLETFTGQLDDPSAATFQVQIADDDKKELIVIHDNRTPLPRRSKQTVTAWAITNEDGATWDLPYTYLGHNLKDFREKKQQIKTYWALELTLPRPNRNSKSRFNEYTFSKEQAFDTDTHIRTARTFLEPTNHKQGSAPIESDTSSVLVVYPDDPVCTALDKTYTISVPVTLKYNRQLRWGFIPEGGAKSDFKILRNRGNTLSLTECDKAGLYSIFRVGRAKKGWLEYIRVIQADCPNGMAVNTGGSPPTTCGVATDTCKNGGIVDQALDLCCCPPGFAGKECEIATEPGTFGSSCQFKISDYIEDSQKGKCLTFSFPDVCGVTCAAGYGGADCCKPCKKGKFGANCAQTCHCVDDACDTFSGACANGCLLPEYSGSNCQ